MSKTGLQLSIPQSRRYLTVASIGWSWFNLFKDTLLCSACIVSYQFLLFDFVIHCFCSIRCLCLIQCLLFNLMLLFSVRIIQCIICSDTGNVLQVFQSRYAAANKQTINTIWVCIAIYFRITIISCGALLKKLVYLVLIVVIFLG
jgi:hypothetical protein